MVDIFEKKLMLMGKKKIKMVTLTVKTSPTGATCKLTYNGTTYTTKSIQVEKGSTVTYSISYSSDYNSSSGSWVITEDTVKNVTLSHKTSTVKVIFYNMYDNNSLTATITVGSKTDSDTRKNGSVYITTTTKKPSYSYTVTHPTLGSKDGTGTATFDYYNTERYAILQSNGTWRDNL